MIDEKTVNQTSKVMQDETVRSEVKVTDELSDGEHTVKVIQRTANQMISASATFIKANIDDFDEDIQ